VSPNLCSRNARNRFRKSWQGINSPEGGFRPNVTYYGYLMHLSVVATPFHALRELSAAANMVLRSVAFLFF
jgi:hypothetical protein